QKQGTGRGDVPRRAAHHSQSFCLPESPSPRVPPRGPTPPSLPAAGRIMIDTEGLTVAMEVEGRMARSRRRRRRRGPSSSVATLSVLAAASCWLTASTSGPSASCLAFLLPRPLPSPQFRAGERPRPTVASLRTRGARTSWASTTSLSVSLEPAPADAPPSEGGATSKASSGDADADDKKMPDIRVPMEPEVVDVPQPIFKGSTDSLGPGDTLEPQMLEAVDVPPNPSNAAVQSSSVIPEDLVDVLNGEVDHNANGVDDFAFVNDDIVDDSRQPPQSVLSSHSIPVSYDERGMVQAEFLDGLALVTSGSSNRGRIDDMSSGAALKSDLEGEPDYPPLVRFLYTRDANGQTPASKLLNFSLLALSFGYVVYAVVGIDRGMTRGWSPTEIGMRIPLDTWASYENSLSEKPVATKTIINVVIYLLGDWLSQTLFRGGDLLDFDAGRTIRNGLVGMCFGPAVHEYYEFSDWILPVDGLTFGITNRAFKILMDQTAYLSVKCSVYILAIGVLSGESVGDSADNVRNRIKPIMFAAWKFWPLVHCVTYGLVPARHRILWVNSVDLVWNAILASKARDDGEGDDDGGGDAEEGGGAMEGILNKLGIGNMLSINKSSDEQVVESNEVLMASAEKGDEDGSNAIEGILNRLDDRIRNMQMDNKPLEEQVVVSDDVPRAGIDNDAHEGIRNDDARDPPGDNSGKAGAEAMLTKHE
ncbi:hypothetical protein ACHAWF_017602, partial [Thalassiosira exigua]